MTSEDYVGLAAVLAAAGLIIYLFIDTARAQKAERRLRAEGRPAQATVISARQTGSWSGNNPSVQLELNIDEPGRPARVIKAEEVIPVIAAALFQPGAVMRVRIDPTDPDHFVFDEPWAIPADE